jgi:SAM-dependent methyltransferase
MKELARHYEKCFEEHGDTAKGFDWPDEASTNKRFQVMLDIMKYDPRVENNVLYSFLDFACGSGRLLEFAEETEQNKQLDYLGVDISEKFVEEAKKKYPLSDCFRVVDVSTEGFGKVPSVDYCVVNGLFTLKSGVSDTKMDSFFEEVIQGLWSKVNFGLAFNTMDLIKVDYTRDDLYYKGYSDIGELMKKMSCKNYVIRQNYGLYEFTTYAYK